MQNELADTFEGYEIQLINNQRICYHGTVSGVQLPEATQLIMASTRETGFPLVRIYKHNSITHIEPSETVYHDLVDKIIQRHTDARKI